MMNYLTVENLFKLVGMATTFVEKPHEEKYVKSINELRGQTTERSSVDKLIDKIINDPALPLHEKAELVNNVETQYSNRYIENTKSCADIIDNGMERKIGRVLAIVGTVAVLGGASYAIGTGIHNHTTQLRIEPNPIR